MTDAQVQQELEHVVAVDRLPRGGIDIYFIVLRSRAWNEVIAGGHYFLQEEWSNANGGCARGRNPIVSRSASRRP